ncbi:D-alanyl-D-alanine carboxypeptidase/D-alanyl-D-alanine endopeptidase [Brevibacillus sp. VP]|uniref:D-alanyl-D-alanine carboxypeptidase/D-alanyl-D-alanine endopeptidase n=1 Tax=unclassified Brevibacillus TaxID=2684853 RepID=UPI000E2FBA2C|nr:D-alanyl-D-alanine carboxypeptidase/D-alanyl-D-alanine-endopeptidase [Brevibacillus sp. VP]RFB34610.1 D-alanyl-D-alanine carboxypeptidase/D-alanyl-D-alanine-endopeptidase [Brevibacillus sp. VP]
MKGKNSLTLCSLLTVVLLMQLVFTPVTALAGKMEASMVGRQIDSLLEKLSQEDVSKGMYAGISVYNLNKEAFLYQHEADKNFIPASNMKLFIAAAALEELGADYQFKTEIYTDGKVSQNGTLQGNLIVKGYGDPTLETKDLQKMATELKQKGITGIQGQVYVDESYFDDIRLGPAWMWDDEVYAYSAQISGLSLHKNSMEAVITPAKEVGKPASVSITPINEYVKVISTVTTTDSKESEVTVERTIGHNQLIIKGTIGRDAIPYKEDVTMEDPVLYVGDVFQSILQSEGISIIGKKTIQKTSLVKGTPIVTHYSRPLSEIVLALNKDSDNFYAEMLTKTLGAVKKGSGSWHAGTEAITEVLREAKFPGTYLQVDGSGLSRLDLITPNQMIALLRYVQKKEYQKAFEASLPIAGIDGTLKSRMKETKAGSNLIAKTGSMGGVNSLSGYVTATNGDKLAFSIMINGIYKSKYATQLQDSIGNVLAEYPVLPEIPNEVSAKSTYELSALLDPLWEDPALANVHGSMIVTSLDRAGSKVTLYEHQADRLLIPGTIIKELSSIGALVTLGENYSFKTEVLLSKPANASGVVEGDIIIKGYGDPTLRADHQNDEGQGPTLEQLVGFLTEKGITQVNGNILIDQSYFDRQLVGLGWPWDAEKQLAKISALTSEAGKVKLTYKPGLKKGDPVIFDMWPKTNYVVIYQDASTVGKGANNTFIMKKERAKNVFRLLGELPMGTKEQQELVSVEEPAIYSGVLFLQKMKDAGIKVSPTSKVLLGQVTKEAMKLGEVQSLALQDILTLQNKNDDHLIAEMVNKTIGIRKAGKGTTEAGIAATQEILKAWRVNTNYDMLDASGVTRYNLLSARQLNDVLLKLAGQKEYPLFYNSLPIAGVDGTLKNRLKRTDAQGNLRALSSQLQGVSSITGYVTTKKNERLAVTIILNGYTSSPEQMSKWEDKVLKLLASYHE